MNREPSIDPEHAQALADRVTFGILTALPKEYAAMKAMLDGSVSYRAPGRGSAHDYEIGEIPSRTGGTHVVAIALGDQGNPNAAVHATTLLHDFPDVVAILMVGIGGGVPNPTKVETHVRLGDIVVSGEHGVVKYDFVKEHSKARFEPRHPPRAPSSLLRQAARRLQSAAQINRPWIQHILRAEHLNYVRPDADTDRLGDSRASNTWIEHPLDDDRREGEPRIFEGTIGAADRLQKNPVRRDMLRDAFGVRAIEMEGFGVAEATYVVEVGFFVIRGICDYCDSNKNDQWQNYAAVIAAAYARALLEEVSVATPRVSALREATRPALPNEGSRGTGFAHAPSALVSRSHLGLHVSMHEADPRIELEHQAHLDTTRALLTKGHARLALDQLIVLRERLWNGASKSVRARVLALTGHAEFELGRFEPAGHSLVRALAENPEDAKTMANGALGHTILGNPTAAIGWARKALELDPTSVLARQILIQHDERDDAAIRQEHEAVLGKRVEIFYALGQRAVRRHDAVRAAQWFEAAAAVNESDADVLAAAGQSLADSIFEKTGCRTFRWEAPGTADAVMLNRAAELIERAWSRLNDPEVQSARIHWLLTLGMVRRALGECGAAVAIAENALKIGGQTRELVRFRAAVASDASDHATVVRLLGDCDDEDDPDMLALLATAEANLSNHDKSLALWKRLLTCKLPAHLREQAECNQVFTLLNAGRFEEARSLVSTLLAEDPTLARQLIAIEATVRLGDHSLRDQMLEKALALATRETNVRDLLRLGDALMNARRPVDAANVYGLAISEPEARERDARRLITALYGAGRFDSALSTCRRVIAKGTLRRFCTEVESVILEELGDLPGARAVCERYLSTAPNDPAVSVRLGIIMLREGDTAGVSSILERIPMAEVVADMEIGTLFVQLLLEAGQGRKALDAAFELRRRHLDQPQAHLLFIAQHQLLERYATEPTSAGIDVAVRMTGTDAPKEWVLITQDPSADARGEEILPTEPLAKELIGRRVGDTVSFKSAPHRRWSVVELSSKYVFAYRQSLAQFGRRFPQDGRLEQHIVPNDTSKFIDDIKKRLESSEPHWQRVLEMYGSSPSVTVGAVGTSLGRTPSESIGIALASPHGLIASANTTEEKRLAARLLEREDITLVADYSSLSLLSELDVLDAALAGRSVAVSQTTIDAFRQDLGRWKSMPDVGFMSLGLRDGQVLRHVHEPDDIGRIRRRYETLLEWIRTRCTVVPIPPQLVEQHAEKRELGKWLGQCFWDSVLLAAEPDRVLLSDDLKLRLLGRTLLGADGVASVHLLIAQRTIRHLDPLTCATALVKLVLAGYKNVATDAVMLEAAARLERWSPFGPFQRVLETLKGPDTELGSAIVVAVEFFRLVWLGLLLPQQRDALCMAVIDALVAGRLPKEVLPRLRHGISTTFRLLPGAAEDINKIVRLWSLIHLQ